MNRRSKKAVFWAAICALVVGAWIRSYFCYDQVLLNYQNPLRYCGVFWNRGECGMEFGHDKFDLRPFQRLEFATYVAGNFGTEKKFYIAGVGYLHQSFVADQIDQSDGVIEIPFWLIGGIAFAILALQLLQIRPIVKRSQRGLCRYCGYDVRATTERCPECGIAMPTNEQ